MSTIKEFSIGPNKVCVFGDHFDMVQEDLTVFSFPVQCRIPANGNSDKDIFLSEPVFFENDGELHVEWIAASELWHKKTYTHPDTWHHRSRHRFHTPASGISRCKKRHQHVHE